MAELRTIALTRSLIPAHCLAVFVVATAACPAEENERPFGISERARWTTSRITGSLEPPAPYAVERVFPNVSLKQPVILTSEATTRRMIAVELRGHVYSFDPQQSRPKLDLVGNLAELPGGFHRVYGLAFHPKFATNGFCYICYVQKDSAPDGTLVSRFRLSVDDGKLELDLASERVVLAWDAGGHNGGCLKFGPDGCLYITTGDGSPPAPPDGRNTGQNIGDLLASILRIDVDHADNGRPYRIPADNPFVSLKGARGEIWAYGFRNPWKISFDPFNGSLWTGDVGWEMWEMIYRVERGGNYGWSLFEGPQPVHQERTRGPTDIIPPTAAHSHTESRSVTGGLVYRGDRLPKLWGAYVYGDYVTGKVWALRHDGKQVTYQEELVDTPHQIIAFGDDVEGRMYIVAYDGTIHRLVPRPSRAVNSEFPTRLSETGLFADLTRHQLADGVLPYSVNAELWSDGATAQRFFGLPGDSRLSEYEDTNVQQGRIKGMWKFPHDGVLGKTLAMEMERGNPASARKLETQILHYDVDTWRAYTYIWNDDQTDAMLADAKGSDRKLTIMDPKAPGGRSVQTWHHASRTECLLCHTTRAGSIHGFNPAQLNRDHDYGQVVDNQLRTLIHLDLFEKRVDVEPRFPSPHDESIDINQRARAWLHVNCGHCHVRGGGGTANFDIPFSKPLAQTKLVGTRPTQGTFGIHDARNVAAGDPYRSVLYYRIAKLGRGRMPHFGSHVVDRDGVDLIYRWIRQLPADGPAPADAPVDDSSDDRLVAERLATVPGALSLLRAVDEPSVSAATARRIVALGSKHEDARVRDLFERFLPENQRTQRLGNVIDPASILSLAGDVARGRDLFVSGSGVQCRNCHRAGDAGKQLGPDFAALKREATRGELLESMLAPSKRIDPKYQTWLVETSAGRVYSGLLVSKSDAEVILKDTQGKTIEVSAADVELLVPQQKSLMPELLLRDLTAQQVADLLEFMLSQRR